MKYGSIYLITNLENNKKYVGQTILSVEQRWTTHQKRIIPNSYINKAILKHGVDKFQFEEICSCVSKDQLNSLEQYFVSYFNSMVPNGYNQTSGGDSNTIFSKEVREKMRKAKLGKKFPRKNKVNQSGSKEVKNSLHAQRLEGETVTTEYNPSTSPQFPSKYLAKKEEIIKLYNESNSIYKVAEKLNLEKTSIRRWLCTWNVLKTQSVAASIRNKRRYESKRNLYKNDIISLHAQGFSIVEISSKTNISYSTLQKWMAKWKLTYREKKIVRPTQQCVEAKDKELLR